MKVITIIFFLFPFYSFGNPQFKEKISDLLHLKPENYTREIDGYHKSIENYFAKRKAICLGEYSSNVLEVEDIPVKKKLSKEEKKLCFDKIKTMQRNYINNIFLARKRYLEFLHKKRVQNLIEAKNVALKDLNAY